MNEEAGRMALEEKIKGKGMVLFVLSKADYSEKLLGILKVVSEQNNNICYISANKPSKAIADMLGASHIDAKKFRFIDCISSSASGGSAKKNETPEGVVFISSPGNLTEISINLSRAMNAGVKNVFVDAISTFLIYDDDVIVVRFAHNLMAKLRESGGKGFFVVLKSDKTSSFLDDLSMFVDSVVEV